MHRLLWVQVPMYSIPWSVIWRWYLIQYISRSSVYNVCDLHGWWWKGLAEIVQGFKLLSLDYQIISNVLTRMGRLAGGSCRKTNEVHGQLGIWKSMGEVRRGWGLEKSDGGVSGSIRLPDMCYNCPFCSIIIETFLYLISLVCHCWHILWTSFSLLVNIGVYELFAWSHLDCSSCSFNNGIACVYVLCEQLCVLNY